jgi:endonuclease/exonuclease/phosphatase (EEP) superfamily protein YafD
MAPRVMRPGAVLLALVAATALVVVAVDALVGPQTGPFALAAVLEPYILVIGAIAGLAAAVSSIGAGRVRGSIRLLAVVVVVVTILRLGGEWLSPGSEPPSGGGGTTADGGSGTAGDETLRVLSWNLELGSKAAADSVAGIAEREVDLVALQELTPEVAAAIEADPALGARFPYRILEPRDGVAGMGLLSRHPLVIGSYSTGPVVLQAGLLLRDGRRLELLDVHPYPPSISRIAIVPVGLETRRRDQDLERIRRMVDELPDATMAIVIGDLNATPFEAGFTILADGLYDAHAEAGSGPGFTWRPSSLEVLRLGLLRMDVVLSGEGLRPVAAGEECSIAGDHCRLYVDLDVSAPAGATDTGATGT